MKLTPFAHPLKTLCLHRRTYSYIYVIYIYVIYMLYIYVFIYLFIHSFLGVVVVYHPNFAMKHLLLIQLHYTDVIMNTMASQITSLTVVYSIVYSDSRSKKTSKFRVTGLCVGNSPGPVNSPHKGPVTRKMFPFDDVIMESHPVLPESVLKLSIILI